MNEFYALLTKYFSIFVGGMFKFIGGPLIGQKLGVSIIETTIFSSLGMLTTIIIITFFGDTLRRKFILYNQQKRNYKVFTPRKRRLIRLYRRFGIKGIAFLTPVIFSPILGGILAVSFGAAPKKIIFYMLMSALFWGLILSSVSHFAMAKINWL